MGATAENFPVVTEAEVASEMGLAEAAARVIAWCQTALAEKIPPEVGPLACDLARRITDAWLRLEMEAFGDWKTSSPAACLLNAPWRQASLCAYICRCQLAMCAADAFGEGADETRWNPRWTRELRDGLAPPKYSVIFDKETLFSRNTEVAEALTVAFETMDETLADVPLCKAENRLSRGAVRTLERMTACREARRLLWEETGCESAQPREEAFFLEEAARKWFATLVGRDANNELLLRMDEWGIACQLHPADQYVCGERAHVPEDHKKTVGAWIAMQTKDDESFRQILDVAKTSEKFEENMYPALSNTLEQSMNYNWIDECFIAARFNTLRALNKWRKYRGACQTQKLPPMILQTDAGKAVLVGLRPDVTVACDDPFKAVSAWIWYLQQYRQGIIGRKKNVAQIQTRFLAVMNNYSTNEVAPVETVGGETIELNF